MVKKYTLDEPEFPTDIEVTNYQDDDEDRSGLQIIMHRVSGQNKGMLLSENEAEQLKDILNGEEPEDLSG